MNGVEPGRPRGPARDSLEELHEEEHMAARRRTKSSALASLREEAETIPAGELVGPDDDPDSVPPPLPTDLRDTLKTILSEARQLGDTARALDELRQPVHVMRTFPVNPADLWPTIFEPLARASAEARRLLADAERYAPGVLALVFLDSFCRPASALRVLEELETRAKAASPEIRHALGPARLPLILPPQQRKSGRAPYRRPTVERDFRRCVAGVLRGCRFEPTGYELGWFADVLKALYPYAVGRPLDGDIRRLLRDTLA
jgi:hypothetical protein